MEIDWRWQELDEKEDCEELAKVRLHAKYNGWGRKSRNSRTRANRSSIRRTN